MSCSCVSQIGDDRAVDPSANYKRVEWVSEGMRVIAAVRDVAPEIFDPADPGQGVWCTVAVAAGTHARIVNEKRGIDRWVHISMLVVPR